MEESVWLYFGFVVGIIAIGIVTMLVMDFQERGREQAFFEGARELARQAGTVCKMPIETKLSVTIEVQSGSTLSTIVDAVCADNGEERRCFPVDCDLEEKTLLDLTDPKAVSLFKSHDYVCTSLRAENINITCSG